MLRTKILINIEYFYVLLTFSITFALIILLVAMYIQRPLELSSFPSILLLTTLFRLAGRNSRRWRIFHLVAWGAAGVLSLLPVALDADLRSGRYWGIYLYLALAVGMVVLETVGPRREDVERET